MFHDGGLVSEQSPELGVQRLNTSPGICTTALAVGTWQEFPLWVSSVSLFRGL